MPHYRTTKTRVSLRAALVKVVCERLGVSSDTLIEATAPAGQIFADPKFAAGLKKGSSGFGRMGLLHDRRPVTRADPPQLRKANDE
jgi:hypothetical protein